MFWVLFFLVLLLNACANPRRAAPEIKSKWSVDEVNRLVALCEKGNGKPSPPDLRVSKYCRCVYRAASLRWSYADYQKNVSAYEAILDNQVAPACESRALRGEE